MKYNDLTFSIIYVILFFISLHNIHCLNKIIKMNIQNENFMIKFPSNH